MMATDNLALEIIDEKHGSDISTPPSKPSKRSRRTVRSVNTNGIAENGHDSLADSIPPVKPKRFETKKVDDTVLQTSMSSESTDRKSKKTNGQLGTPIASPQLSETNDDRIQQFQRVELANVTDEDDDENKTRSDKRQIQTTDQIITDHDTMVSSYTTGGDNDVIEIHEFSAADIDAYLDIYFETLNNRLRHFLGDDEQVQQFRLAMKNRLTSNTNSREYQNVLLGKMSNEVVAAVTLSFPGETTTISNDNILPQSNSCLTSIRRWMIRNANYVPTNIQECYIEMIGVKSAFRNHGIGAAMLECVEQFARQAGALVLTVHPFSDQLRNYFHRSGYVLDHSDSSAFWKWAVERQSVIKMVKTIPPDDGNYEYPMDNTSSYNNESMTGSDGE